MPRGQRLSDDMRHTIIRWHKDGTSARSIAQLLDPDVKITAIKDVISTYKQTRWIATPGSKGRTQSEITARATELVYQMVMAEPRLYLREYQAWLRLASKNCKISIGSIHNILQTLNISRHKIEQVAAQRRQAERCKFMGRLMEPGLQDVTRFFFVDETSKGKGDMRRTHGYGPKGCQSGTWLA